MLRAKLKKLLLIKIKLTAPPQTILCFTGCLGCGCRTSGWMTSRKSISSARSSLILNLSAPETKSTFVLTRDQRFTPVRSGIARLDDEWFGGIIRLGTERGFQNVADPSRRNDLELFPNILRNFLRVRFVLSR